MLSRVVIALGLAAAVVSGGALAFLRTDFVANNLCSYAVATIEEATQAQVKVARCSVEPAVGKLTIDGLQVGVPQVEIFPLPTARRPTASQITVPSSSPRARKRPSWLQATCHPVEALAPGSSGTVRAPRAPGANGSQRTVLRAGLHIASAFPSGRHASA